MELDAALTCRLLIVSHQEDKCLLKKMPNKTAIRGSANKVKILQITPV